MRFGKKSLLTILLLSIFAGAFAQPDSCALRISLLTCGPGLDLYSIWGHTGIRVTDSSRGVDVVFNYGTFDDSDPLFYIKFTRGIMLYSVTPFSFNDFMEEYRQGNRRVDEQELNLSCAQKKRLVQALWLNTQPENRFYPYQFYADNCTTRARDMIARNAGPVQFRNILPAPATYRQLIHSYMNSSGQSWNRLAIDIFLGKHLDETMNQRQVLFLPDYLMKGFDSATVAGKPLVLRKQTLNTANPADDRVWYTPAVVFSLMLLLMMLFSFFKNNSAQAALQVIERVLLLVTGFFGLLMALLWIGRVDIVCRNNWNLLWAWPSHLWVAFMIQRKNSWLHYYWISMALANLLLLLAWAWLPQEMNSQLIPWIVMLILCGFLQYRKTKHP